MNERQDAAYKPACKTANICTNYVEGLCTSEIGTDCKDLVEKLGEAEKILLARKFAFGFVGAAEKSIDSGNPYNWRAVEICTGKHILDERGKLLWFAPATQPWVMSSDLVILGDGFLKLAQEVAAYDPTIEIVDLPTSTYFLRDNQEVSKFEKGRISFSAGEI